MSLDLDAIKTRADAATPGPWPEPEHDEDEGGWVVMNGQLGTKEHAIAFVVDAYSREYAKPNAEFIAHAREDVPALLAEVERLREAEARVRKLAEIWLNKPKDAPDDALTIAGQITLDALDGAS